jgi:hypothetical protein
MVTKQRLPFGEYSHRLEELIDADGVARILTLRAAQEGIFRVYTRKSVGKAVDKGSITPVAEEGLKHYFLIEEAETMPFKPKRGRKTPSIRELQRRLDKLLSAAYTPPWRIDRARTQLTLAIEAQDVAQAQDVVLEQGGEYRVDYWDGRRRMRWAVKLLSEPNEYVTIERLTGKEPHEVVVVPANKLHEKE